MATRVKTIRYAHPPLASMVDNTLTSLSQITIYVPETIVGFESVVARVTCMGTATATGNITTRRLQCRLGAAGYTTHTNSNLYTGSGEDIFVQHAVDLTSHFATNWTGTSMTFDSQALMDGTATGIAWTNICVEVFITYAYDDTSSTQIKTVYIPLDMPTTNLGTSKPGTALATIPNLSTELPEASKTFRNHFITIQGNVRRGGTTDITMSMQLDSTASNITGIFEGASNIDFFYRYIWNAPNLDTGASMGWYAWANATDFNHSQAWLTVTYEFDATAANDIFVSITPTTWLPLAMGGTTSSDYQRGNLELYIEEPATITTKQVAFFPFWIQTSGTIAGLNMRIGTGSFVTYTDAGGTLAGSNAAMVRNDSAFTLTRGKNVLNYDVYRTTLNGAGTGLSGFWIINYTCGKPFGGHGAANHTVVKNLGATFGGASSQVVTLSGVLLDIPESNYYINSIGVNYKHHSNSTASFGGYSIGCEQLASTEGGLIWQDLLTDSTDYQGETGIREVYGLSNPTLFKTHPNSPTGLDVETARRLRIVYGVTTAAFHYLDLMMTYHSVTSTVSGDITDSNGGTVNLSLHRAATDEKVLATSRSGNGAYSFPWYDNTEDLYVVAYENDTYKGRSGDGTATLDS